MTTTSTNQQAYRVREVAEILGLGVSTVWRKTRARELPQPIRIGGATRWRRADIEDLLSDKDAA